MRVWGGALLPSGVRAKGRSIAEPTASFKPSPFCSGNDAQMDRASRYGRAQAGGLLAAHSAAFTSGRALPMPPSPVRLLTRAASDYMARPAPCLTPVAMNCTFSILSTPSVVEPVDSCSTATASAASRRAGWLSCTGITSRDLVFKNTAAVHRVWRV